LVFKRLMHFAGNQEASPSDMNR